MKNSNLSGQSLVEYMLILAFISVVAISVLVTLGDGSQAKSLNYDHYWHITSGGETWNCNVPPSKDEDGNPVIYPVGNEVAPVTIHGAYTVQEINKTKTQKPQ